MMNKLSPKMYKILRKYYQASLVDIDDVELIRDAHSQGLIGIDYNHYTEELKAMTTELGRKHIIADTWA